MSYPYAPAPWHTTVAPSYANVWQVRDLHGNIVATCEQVRRSADDADANAKLIAAAPDLLAAITRLSAAALARDNVMGDPCALLAAKAELADANRAACEVIAQARGQS